ncbi:MAG: AMP-binding protein [archaeon]|nr:AMP-binding protein [archaeon]
MYDATATRWVIDAERLRSGAERDRVGLALARLVRRCQERVPFYRDRLRSPEQQQQQQRHQQGITLENYATLVAPTSKKDLRESHHEQLLGVAREEVRRFHSTSGTSGAAVLVGHTQGDMDAWTLLMGRTLRVAGVRPGDRFYNAYSYGPFTGGQGYHQGASTVPGVCVIPACGVSVDRHVRTLSDLRVEVLGCTPHQALGIASHAHSRGVALHLRLIITGSEPFSDAFSSGLMALLPSLERVVDVYGLGEAMGPGVAAECGHPEASGTLHLWDDYFYAEVVDAEGRPVPDGEPGELLLTPLFREASPLLRYRTGDRTRVVSREQCPCGLPSMRIARICDRVDDAIFVNGATLFPSSIAAVLASREALSPNHHEVHVTPHSQQLADFSKQAILVKVEAHPSLAPDAYHATALDIEEALNAGFISCEPINVQILPPMSLPRYEGKSRQLFR